jgi:hypothetical protein
MILKRNLDYSEHLDLREPSSGTASRQLSRLERGVDKVAKY